MNPILKSTLGGLIAAILVDLHAWSNSDKPFEWSLAIKRWSVGLLSGFFAGAGM